MHDPNRLPTRKEAVRMLPSLKKECTLGYDSNECDWLVYHLVRAYATGQLQLIDKVNDNEADT